MIKHFRQLMLSCCVALTSATPAVADIDTINTMDIMNITASCDGCADWQFIGMCFWLRCSGFSCSVRESPKISQYNPDLLVATYSTQSPLDVVRGVNPIEDATISMDEKTDESTSSPLIETYLDFKHAEIFVNPSVVPINIIADSTDWFCKSGVEIPYFPHFLSAIDPMWNEPQVENFFPQAIMGLPKFRSRIPLGYWAPVYPRCGWGSHPVDAINGFVAAHRAADITTSRGAPHVYLPPGTNCGNRCWRPGPIREGRLSTHKFQMLHPVGSTSGRLVGGGTSWANGKNRRGDEAYAWTLWRPYKCCRRKGSFLFSIDW